MSNLKYDILLADADETLLDFKRSEQFALEAAMTEYGLEYTQEKGRKYSEINLSLWKQLEKSEISREALESHRFELFFADSEIKPDYLEFNMCYLNKLSTCKFLIDGAYEFLEQLHNLGIKIYIITNGLILPQTSRIMDNKIAKFISGLYISEKMGVQKPDKEYFDKVFEDLKITDRSRTILLGDSLTSDIQGGRNAGITTCRYIRSGKKENNPFCDYEITDYSEFFNIITF